MENNYENLEVNIAAPLAARQYQLDLLEHVTHNNGIIYLPTGAGKTYVAILALKRFSTHMKKTMAEGGKRAIFMCNTVEVARQQSIEIRKHCNLKVRLYIGEQDFDNWQPTEWQEELDNNEVLVGTAQIFINIVSKNYIKISDLCIVIIDECHHGTKSHPMHEFMRMFQLVQNQSLLPRVVGLTGVLLKGNKLNNIMDSLRSLEITYRAKIVTINSKNEFLNVMIHSTSPNEKVLIYGPTSFIPKVYETIKDLIYKCLAIIDEFDIGNQPLKLSKGLAKIRDSNKKTIVKNWLKDISFHLYEYGMYCSLFVLESAILDLEIKLLQAETIALRRMYRVSIRFLETVRHIMFTSIKDYQNNDKPNNKDVITKFSTPKVISLLEYISSVFEGRKCEDVTCLVFVERRLTAKAICSVIQKFVNLTPSLNEILIPEFMVGRNTMLLTRIENVLDSKWNRKVMSNFRDGACNMIVCSNVLEEGIDVQACNFVIVFDELKTFNSYIQTKGRARTKGSTYAIMASKVNKKEMINQLYKYQQVHETIREFLFERTLETPYPNQEEIDTEFDNKMLPLRTPQGACLLPSSALTTLNRYCQMLPWDIFGYVLPQYTKMPMGDKLSVVVSLKLPLQSRVKEIILSDPMENTKMAIVSAALKACKKLYEKGELKENLLPLSKKDCIKTVSSVLFKHWEKFEDSVIESKKNAKAKVRLYDRKCPDELYNALPILGEVCYAYEILFTPDFERNDYNAHVFDALKTTSNYAILLRKLLPRLAEMTLFMRQGSVKVRIIDRPLELRIKSEEELQQLRKYHIMVMRDLLECWRSYYVHDMRNKQNSFLIVPLKSGTIDWNTVQRFERLKPLIKPSLSERQSSIYRPEDWLGKIVGKWYATDTSERFLVTNVYTHQTPLDLLPNDMHQELTYLQFFESRYGNQIDRVINKNQFLIEVKILTARRNFFNNAKSKEKEIKRDTKKIVLLPELCHNFEHPGDLWLKALFLPSILHRLHFMLHAENVRVRINSFLGLSDIFNDYKPKPLVIDKSLRRAVDSDGNACEFQEEIPILLPPLPSSANEEIGFKIFDLTNSSELWKSYVEPMNIARSSQSIYPVELQYFYNFTVDWEKRLKLLQAPENVQFQMNKDIGSNLNAISNFEESTIASQLGALSIKDVSIEEKRRIGILERSLLRKDFLPCSIEPAEQHDFVAALTASGANDVFDMERFELLGDSFLKFSMSLYLANKFPEWHEGFLTDVKSKLVSNRNLLYCLLETDISERICSSLFSMHEWLPPLISLPDNILELLENDTAKRAIISVRDLFDIELNESEVLSGHCNEEHFTQFMNACECNEARKSDFPEVNIHNDLNFCTYKDVRADYVVADTVEALLGVCVKNYGFNMSFQMLEFFGLCRPKPGERPLTNLLDLELGGDLQSNELSKSDIDDFLLNHQFLEKNLGYTFQNRFYLLKALTHPSFPTNRLTGCYQKLEFIGDAILDILVTCYIFERYESMTPGKLTDLRSALVNNITLGCICVRHRFHLFLLAENVRLAESIKRFAEFQETQGHRVTDQVHILMEEDTASCAESYKGNFALNVEVPKALGDIVEALIAAVYLDSRCLQTTWNVIYHMLEPELNQFRYKVPIDPVRQLHEHPWANAQFSDPIVQNNTTLIKCSFSCLKKSVVVNGFGINKHQAKKSAAKHALQILAKNSN